MARAYPAGFDAHTHLDFPAFDADREAVLNRAREAGIGGWVLAGADPADWDRLVAIAASVGGVACLGIHPWWVEPLDDAAVAIALDDLATRDVAGIGETGLDFYRATDPSARDRQTRLFRAHLALCRDRQLPVVIHCVRAYPELLAILARDGAPAGMIHSWSGPAEAVETATDLGLMVSLGSGVLKSGKARRAAARVPAHQLLIETDCPDQPIPGVDRGEPAHLVAIAARIAKVRGTQTAQILEETAANARRLFGVSA